MNDRFRPCRLCGAENQELLLANCPGAFGDSYDLLRCTPCTFVTTSPLPDAALLEASYRPEYWSRAEGRSRMLNTLFKLRSAGLMRSLKHSLPRGARILDWGCGDGALAALMHEQGFQAFGLDKYLPMPPSSRFLSGDIETPGLAGGPFQAITCFHLLEHLEDPVRSLQAAFDLLTPGGLLLMEVPNIDSLGFRIFGKRWQPLEIPLHVNHFSRRSLVRLFHDLGQARIEKWATFSWRTSAASVVLSLLPSLAPAGIRRRHQGGHPLSYLLLYLTLQAGALPYVLGEAAMARGEVLRLWVRKNAQG